MVHIAESTVGRRYAGWFIKNTERTQRIFDELRNAPLPVPAAKAAAAAAASTAASVSVGTTDGAGKVPASRAGGQKVAWGGVKVA